MEVPDVFDKIHELSDLELATLLCLVAKEHCIISTESDVLNDLEQELQLAASHVFGLSSAVIRCADDTTIDDFHSALLMNDKISNQSSVLHPSDTVNALDINVPTTAKVISFESQQEPLSSNTALNHQRISNVIIARNINLTDALVQIQVLELIRSRRISVGTAVYNVPKHFLVIFLLSSSGPRLVKHLNDQVFISHYHDPEDGFINLEDNSDWFDDRASMSSVVHKSKFENVPKSSSRRVISHTDIDSLVRRIRAVTITAEVKRYLQNIVVFLRLHRAVAGGVSARATKHFDLLVKCLALLHSLNYVTPSLVALAARKIYPHRLSITSPKNERSMQYGSELAAVTAMLEGITPEHVIEEVLAAVEVPL